MQAFKTMFSNWISSVIKWLQLTLLKRQQWSAHSCSWMEKRMKTWKRLSLIKRSAAWGRLHDLGTLRRKKRSFDSTSSLYFLAVGLTSISTRKGPPFGAVKAGQAREKPTQNKQHHIRVVHMFSAPMNVTVSENKIVSILVALVFCTALTYFHYFLIVLNFFFSLLWICGIMLGRNTNLSLVQQTLLIPQLPQPGCFIFVTGSAWHQLVLTQKNKPHGQHRHSLAKLQ